MWTLGVDPLFRQRRDGYNSTSKRWQKWNGEAFHWFRSRKDRLLSPKHVVYITFCNVGYDVFSKNPPPQQQQQNSNKLKTKQQTNTTTTTTTTTKRAVRGKKKKEKQQNKWEYGDCFMPIGSIVWAVFYLCLRLSLSLSASLSLCSLCLCLCLSLCLYRYVSLSISIYIYIYKRIKTTRRVKISPIFRPQTSGGFIYVYKIICSVNSRHGLPVYYIVS